LLLLHPAYSTAPIRRGFFAPVAYRQGCTSIRNSHRSRTPIGFTVKYSFDIVAIRIQHKRCVVAGVVTPLAWRAVIPSTMGQCSFIERIHHSAVLRLECYVMPTSQLTLYLGAVDR